MLVAGCVIFSRNLIQAFFGHLCPECLSLPGVALLGGLGNGRAEDVAEGDEVLVLETPRGVLWDDKVCQLGNRLE